jgi:curli biogenesis system outer membrane secretion channel CsgG
MPNHPSKVAVLVSLTISSLCGANAFAAAEPPPIPVCDKKIGTLAVTEPQNRWWVAYNLESPEALIKVFVAQSKCFTLVDRGKGLAAAQTERSLASSGEMRGGSNIGKGQMKAADYVLVPDIVNQNSNSSGNRFGGLLGGKLGGVAGAVIGGVSLKSKTADVVLTVTDVRSTEQVAMQQGHAKKTDIGWGGGGGSWFGALAAAGASGYANTEIGQVVALAYIDAYTKLVSEVKGLSLNAKEDNVQQSVTMAKPGKLYEAANVKSAVVRDLDVGTTLYPTGEKDKIWWKVSDELGNEGWVPSPLFQLAK